MSELNLEKTAKLVAVPSPSQCNTLADVLRTVTMAEFNTDYRSQDIMWSFINEHLSDWADTLVGYRTHYAVIERPGQERPNSTSPIVSTKGYGELNGVLIMNEIVTSNGVARYGALPDLYLELVVKRKAEGSYVMEEMNRMWLPVQHLQELQFFGIGEESLN